MKLQRTSQGPVCTLGRLTTDEGNIVAVTLELPDHGNAKDVSCIPAGSYRAELRDSPKRGYQVYGLLDVPDRDDIEIHIGNFPVDTDGCILVGTQVGEDEVSIEGSAVAFHAMMAELNGAPFVLDVMDPQ
jgi:hypothetical protein